MNYNTSLKIAYFVGPTNMIGSDNDSIYCEKGWYNTNTGIALLRQNTWLKSKQQIINSDTLYYEKLTGIGKAYSNTVIVDTTQNILICGDYALYNRIKQTAVVTKKAMMIQVDNEDSLFLHADTIRSGLFVVHPDSLIAGTTAPDTYKTAPDTYKTKPDTYKTAPDTFKTASDTFKTAPDTFQTVADTFQTASDTFQTASDTFKFVKAYYHVKFFRSDLQGKCDSMFYSFKDSVLQLYRKPVLWTGKTQLTAEQINLLTHNQKIDKMLLNKSAFVISQEDSVRFQQIKGRNMIGYFDQHNKLYKMDVKGNGQTIYFAYQDNKEDSTQELIGVKKTESSAITIFLKDSKPTIITFINTVSGTFYPPLELSGQDLYLKNFMWYDKLRPNTPDDIFEWKN